MPDDTTRHRIAIIGAGPAGLSAAFHLTSEEHNPGWRSRYEVDVYTLGWRVGGKGATGRRADMHDRLQEHGIHVFGNMYFNSLTMVHEALEELRAAGVEVGTMETEFLPSDLATGVHWLPNPTLGETGFKVDGHWAVRRDPTPMSEGVPWEPPRDPDPKLIVQSALSMVDRHLVEAAIGVHQPEHGWRHLLGKIRGDIGRALVDAGAELERHLFAERDDPHHPGGHDRHHGLLEFLDSTLLATLNAAREALPGNVDAHATYCMADLVSATLRGLVDEDLVNQGLDSVDDVNYDEWLERNGISEYTLRSSIPQVIPNTALSYFRGDTTKRPTMAASAYLEFFCRQMTGKGTFAYFFREGTGETVMRPLYQVLSRRGVRFHFFHKLRAVVPGTGDWIERFELDVQATPIDDRYDPFVTRSTGEQVWPDRPVFDRLVEGDRLRAGTEIPGGGFDLESWWTAWEPVGTSTLERGRDFDLAVLATPVATLPHTCAAVVEHPAGERWGPMLDHSHTAASQALQLWFDATPAQLGLMVDDEFPGNRALGPSFGQDLTSYADFSDLIPVEGWDPSNSPRALLYMIGLLQDPEEIPGFDDHDYPARMYQRALWSAAAQLRGISGLLPGATNPDVDYRSLDFDLLHDESGATGLNRIESQYLKVNIDPNERYTISLKGCLKHRLKAWESGFSNLALAGDWIYTGFNVGSFEGAVMSGKLASLAIAGAPELESIWGYTFMNPSNTGPTRRLLDG